jgi:hypothetical protein
MKRIQVYSNEVPSPVQRGDNHSAKIEWDQLHIKIFENLFKKPLSQKQIKFSYNRI